MNDVPLRLLLVHAQYRERGGEDQAVDDLEREMSARGVHVNRFDAFNESGGAATLARAPHNARVGRELRVLLERLRPDVVHVHNTWWSLSPIVIGISNEFASTVVSLHNYRAHCVAGDLLRDGAPCIKCVGRGLAASGVAFGCYRGSRVLSAQAAMTSAALRRMLSSSKLPNSVLITAPTQFSADLHVRGGIARSSIRVVSNLLSTREGPGCSNNLQRTDFAYVGRLSREKGVPQLLRLWAAAREDLAELQNSRLVIAGDGDLLPSQAKASGVVAVGHLPRAEALHLIGSSRALIFPSLCFENQPMAVLEAMALGTPVLYNRGGAVEEVAGDGQLGFDLSSYESFRRAIIQCLDPARASVVANYGRARFNERYSVDKVANHWIDIYQEAIEAFATPPTRLVRRGLV